MNTTVVFLGPSLDEATARRLLDAEYRPPAAQGDVLAAFRAGARRIGILDGTFNHVPSVWHKEILLAIEQGAVVFGAASMGALRAAELHQLGMIGVGRVFEWYRDGVLEDDDEVAVIHGPRENGYLAQSEALVNIRDVLEAAREAGIVRADVEQRLLALAKEQFYMQRSYASLARLAREGGVDVGVLQAFLAFASEREPLKRRDARALLARMNEVEPSPGAKRPVTVERTFFLRRLEARVELELAAAGSKVESEGTASASPASALTPQALNDLRKRTLLRVLASKHAKELGVIASAEETQAMADDFRRARQLTSAESMQRWLDEAGFTLERFSEVIQELATVRKLERHYALEVERRLADHLKLGLGPAR